MLSTIVTFAMYTNRTKPPAPLARPAIEACSQMLWSHAGREDNRAFHPDWLPFLLRDYSQAKIIFRVSSHEEERFHREIVDRHPYLIPKRLVRGHHGVITALAHGTPAELNSLALKLRGSPEFRRHSIEIVNGLHRGRRLNLTVQHHVIEPEIDSLGDLANALDRVPEGAMMVDDTLNGEAYVVMTADQVAVIPLSLLNQMGIQVFKVSLARLAVLPAADAAWMVSSGSRWVFSLTAFEILQALATIDRARHPALSDSNLSLVDRIVMDSWATTDRTPAN